MPQIDLYTYFSFSWVTGAGFFVFSLVLYTSFLRESLFETSKLACNYFVHVLQMRYTKNNLSFGLVAREKTPKIWTFIPLGLSDPLAQFYFETFNFIQNYESYYAWSVRNIVVILVVVIGGYILTLIGLSIGVSNSFKTLLIAQRVTIFTELVGIVATVVRENLSVFASRYAIFLETVFYFILVFNFLGLIPYGFTITSHISFTLFLSLAFFIGINIIGIRLKGWEIFGLFLPSGVPLFISPFLVIIEIISYFARLFSLGIRLFANMMAGHALTIILSGYAWAFFFEIMSAGVFAFLIIFCVIGLEFMVAFLQAYVFTMLISIYINDVVSGH